MDFPPLGVNILCVHNSTPSVVNSPALSQVLAGLARIMQFRILCAVQDNFYLISDTVLIPVKPYCRHVFAVYCTVEN